MEKLRKKSPTELNQILYYYQNLEDFIQMIKICNLNEKYANELISMIAMNTEIQKYSNRVLFRFGENGSNFYIVLQGKVEILVPKADKIYMTEEEYINYLLRLRRNEEIELISLCLLSNAEMYNIDHDFDDWMKQLIYPSVTVEKNDRWMPKNYKKLIRMVSLKPSKEKIELGNAEIGKFKDKRSYIMTEKAEKKNLVVTNQKILNKIRETLHYLQKTRTKETSLNTTLQDYLAISQPESIINSNDEERKLLTIFTYKHVKTIQQGERFGDIALESTTNKRTASVIIDGDCTLGIINKPFYKNCIKEIQEKSRKQFVSFLFNYEIFKQFSKANFENRYSRHFKFIKYSIGDKLFTENTPLTHILFIKSGEFEISTFRSILEINQITGILKDNKSNSNFSENLLSLKKISDKNYTTSFLMKKQIKLGIIKDSEIIGLYELLHFHSFNEIDFNDYICNNTPIVEINNLNSFFTVTCRSLQAEVYSIPIEYFNDMYIREKIIRDNCSNYYKIRKEFYISRLENYKNSSINIYKNKKLETSCSMNNLRPITSFFNSELTKSLSNKAIKKNFIRTHNSNQSKIHSSRPLLITDNNNRTTCNDLSRKSLMIQSSSPTQKEFFNEYKTKILKKNLFNDIFSSYLKTDTNEEMKIKDDPYFQRISPLIKAKIDSSSLRTFSPLNSTVQISNEFKRRNIRNKTIITNNTITNNSTSYHTILSEKTLINEKENKLVNPKIVDPLMMDNFNRAYSKASIKLALNEAGNKNNKFVIKINQELKEKIMKWKIDKKINKKK